MTGFTGRKCDRCGKETRLPLPHYGWGSIHFRRAAKDQRSDVCSDCANSFERWWHRSIDP